MKLDNVQLQNAAVYVRPDKLTKADKLTDGRGGQPLGVQSESTLVWVDLRPDANFEHPTEHVLISAIDVHVTKGKWWPVLNDKDLFREEAGTTIESPMRLVSGKSELCQGMYSAQQGPGVVLIFAAGVHPTGGYLTYFEELPIEVFPPEFRLMHAVPTGIVSQLISPFSVHTRFETKNKLERVFVRDAKGKHEVKLEQVPGRSSNVVRRRANTILDGRSANTIPGEARLILEQAEEFELLSIDPGRPQEKPKDDFHAYIVLGKTLVKDAGTRKSLIEAFKKGVSEDAEPAWCFIPRHGIRATHGGKTADFLICFECQQVRLYYGDKKEEHGFLITDFPQPVFNKVLTDAGVPLAQ